MTEVASEAAISDLIAHLTPQLRKVFSRYRVPLEDADDILQEAVLAVLRKWHSIEKKDAWLMSTVRQMCCEYWKAIFRSPLQAAEPAMLEIHGGAVAPPQERRDLFADLAALSAKLPQRQRQQLFMHYRLGMGESEIARVVGSRKEAVRKDCHRAVTRMKSLLHPRGRGGIGSRLR
jgi:RNA polymerase sigma factor (sigma-70 family)